MGKDRHGRGGYNDKKNSQAFHKAKSIDKEKKLWRAEMHNATFFKLSGANGFRRGQPEKNHSPMD
jgi:hypothetical protein